jgi:NAD(P)-dependent dehydrogenase (short-subunit alcohol dehydrogenase family)
MHAIDEIVLCVLMVDLRAIYVQAEGGEAYGIAADVGKDCDNKRIVDETMEKYGRLDVSFINAGVAELASFSEVSTPQHELTHMCTCAQRFVSSSTCSHTSSSSTHCDSCR